MQLTKKQTEVYKSFLYENPIFLICSGAKRSGKTFVLIYIFLNHIVKYRDKGLNFIIAGVTAASIQRNVLDPMELILGKELTKDKANAVEIFGNKVYILDGEKSNSWKKARGFTAAGAFINEATALHDTFVKEIISRCSHKGARIFIDTNPENPAHPIKVDYIDKDGQLLPNGQLNIRAFHFTLFDNDALDDEYIQSIVAATPTGMFSDRDIHGKWVSAEGVVYQDFNREKHYITPEKINKLEIEEVFAGVDWGYEHYGSIVVIGKVKDTYILLEEHAYQHKEIDFWANLAHDINKKYGYIVYYCDSARPEHIARFRREKLNAVNANKSILSGIESVSSLFKQDKLFINTKAERFKKEINMYAWNKSTGMPIKLYDDVLDSLRYAIYSEKTNTGKIKTISKTKLGL